MISLYADEDSMRQRVIDALRDSGMDVLTTREAGRLGDSDDKPLAFAAESHRCVLTSNQGDFARLHKLWMNTGRTPAGIIILSDQRISATVQAEALMHLATAVTEQDATNRVHFLANWILR